MCKTGLQEGEGGGTSARRVRSGFPCLLFKFVHANGGAGIILTVFDKEVQYAHCRVIGKYVVPPR